MSSGRIHKQGDHEQVADLLKSEVLLNGSGHSEVDDFSIVSVCGGRGTGKTTVLKQARPMLKDEGHLVTELLRPDLFARFESLPTALINAVILEIQETGRSRELHQSGGEQITLEEWGRRLIRRAAIGRSADFMPGGSLDQYAADDARASEVAFSFASEWEAFVDAVRPGGGLLVASVDDLDLATERLTELIDDLRVLASPRGVAFLVAIDLEEARRVLATKMAIAPGQPSAPALRETASGLFVTKAPASQATVDGQLTKLFRPDLRVSLRPLMPSERLDFKPIGEPESISELLDRFELGGMLGGSTMLGLFRQENLGRVTATPYANCLSSNRRRLTSLHRQMAHLLKANHPETIHDTATANLARLLLEHGAEEGVRESYINGIAPSDFIRFDDDEAGDPVLHVDFRSLSYFGAIRDRSTVWQRRGSDKISGRARSANYLNELTSQSSHGLALQLAGGFTVRIRLADSSSDTGPAVSPALANVLLLARDLSINYGIPCDERVSGNPPYRGGFGRKIVALDDTDDEFIQLPLWDGELDYWLFDQTWGQIVKIVDSTSSDSTSVAIAAVADAWRSVMTIQTSRRGASPETMAGVAEGRRPSPEVIEDALHDCGRIYLSAVDDRSVRARDYVDWFESSLPMALHPWLLPEPTVQRGIEILAGLFAEAGRTAEASARLESALRRRVVRGLGEEWVDPLIALVRRFGTDEEADSLLERHRRQLESREALRAGRIGGVALSEGGGGSDHLSGPEDLFAAASEAVRTWGQQRSLLRPDS